MTTQDFLEASRADGMKIERLIRRFYSRLPQRDVFIDGGAHLGYHTGFARYHFTGRVISVEASPTTYVEHISRQMKVHGPGICEVIPVHAALGNRAEQGEMIDFYFSPTHPGRSTVNTKLWQQWAKGEVVYEPPVRAPVIEIDDLKALFGRDRRVDFVKLDLEGGEIKALRGGLATLRSDRPAVVSEFALRRENEHLYGESCDGFADMMRSCGYDLFTPWAELANELVVRGYPYWYVFALPSGDGQKALTDLLRTCYEEALTESA